MEEGAKQLRILLLGSPRVFYDEQEIHIKRRLLRALFFYLASQPNPVGRSVLMDLFWPEESEEDARRHIREALSKLRAELPDSSLIVATQDHVRLDTDQVYVDLLDYQALLEQVRPYLQRGMHTPLPEAIYQQMVKAVNLWRGTEFLSGANLPSTDGLDHWLSLTSQSLSYSYQNLLETLSEHCAISGDLENAVYWIRKAIQMDEENPDLYYQLIQWLHELGRRSEALGECERIRQLYESMGERLPTILNNLCQRIREEGDLPPSQTVSPWHNLLTLQLPFVGRKKLLNDLKLALQRGGVEVIWGEGGAGKSRLVFEFYQSLQPAPRLLLAAGFSHQSELPYQPLIDLLRHSVTVEEWHQLDAVWAGYLTALLPELPSLRPDVYPPFEVSLNHQHQQIAEAFLQLFRILSRRQRLLLFLDDAQWCDEMTFHVLAYLLDHRLFSQRGLLVVAARPEEPNPALERFLSQSQIPWMVHQTTLELLNRDEISELIRLALGKSAPDEFVSRLGLETGGNPLFVLETLRAVLDFNLDLNQLKVVAHLPLASSIHALARERLRLLEPQTRQALVTAAVIGNTFPLRVLQAAAQLDIEACVQAIEELERTHLIRPVHSIDQTRQYAFIHDKIREVLLFELSPARLQLLNLRVAEAYISLEESAAYAERIASHLELAGENLRAFQYWLSAAEYAMAHHQTGAAENAFRRAEKILPRIETELTEEHLYRLYAQWGDFCCQQNQLEQAEQNYAALLRFGELRYSPLLIGSAYSGLARVAGLRQQARLALAQLEHAIPFLRQSGNQYEMIEAGNRRADFLAQLLRHQEAIYSLENVLEMAGSSHDQRSQRAVAEAQAKLAYNYLLLAKPQQGRAAARQALESSLSVAGLAFRIDALMWLALSEYLLAEFNSALQHCEEAIEMAQAVGDDTRLAYLLTIRGNIHLYRGSLTAAWQDSQRAIQLVGGGKSDDILARAVCIQGDMMTFLRDYESAVEYYRRGLEISRNPISAMECLFRLGTGLVLNGQPENGFPFLHKSIELSRESGLEIIRLPAQMGEVLSRSLDPNGGVDLSTLNGLRNEAEQHGLAALGLIYYWLAAQIAREGEPPQAIEHGRRLIQRARELGILWGEIAGLELLLGLPISPEERQQRLQELRGLMTYLDEQSRLLGLNERYVRLRERLESRIIL